MAASTAAIERRPDWRTFLTLAGGIAVIDQITKALLISSLGPGESRPVIGDYLRIVHGQNSGALFGMFRDNAALFGVVALGVIALIVVYHARSGRSPFAEMIWTALFKARYPGNLTAQIETIFEEQPWSTAVDHLCAVCRESLR